VLKRVGRARNATCPKIVFLRLRPRRLSGLQTNFILISGPDGTPGGLGVIGGEAGGRATRGVGPMDDSYPGIVGATVFVNVTTKLSAVPRLTRHSLKFHREIAPQARWATEGGACVRACVCVRARVGEVDFSHFAHCACPRFDNARLAGRHESDPRRPLRLTLSVSLALSCSFSTIACSNYRDRTQTTAESTIGCLNLATGKSPVTRFSGFILNSRRDERSTYVHDVSKYDPNR
jgi:hypothetical protein